MCYIGVTERKIENLKKEGKMSLASLFSFTRFAYLNVNTKLKTLAPIAVEKSATEILIGEEEK